MVSLFPESEGLPDFDINEYGQWQSISCMEDRCAPPGLIPCGCGLLACFIRAAWGHRELHNNLHSWVKGEAVVKMKAIRRAKRNLTSIGRAC